MADGNVTGNFTITVNDTDTGHDYEAYQIFSGTLSSTGSGASTTYKLSDIDWGSGVEKTKEVGDSKTTLLDALKAIKVGNESPFSSLTAAGTTDDEKKYPDAKAVADILGKDATTTATDSDIAKAFANVIAQYLSTSKTKLAEQKSDTTPATTTGYKNTGTVSAGYYLIKDETRDMPTGDSYTYFMLEVVNDVNATPKKGAPKVEKKVLENGADGSPASAGWQDTADYTMQDTIQYKLTGTLPSNFKYYTSYTTYTFTDTVANGLDILADATGSKIADTSENAPYVTVLLTTTESTDTSFYEAGGTLKSNYTDITKLFTVSKLSEAKYDESASNNDAKSFTVSLGKDKGEQAIDLKQTYYIVTAKGDSDETNAVGDVLTTAPTANGTQYSTVTFSENSKIIVVYNAKLNANANIGTSTGGNPNKVTLTYPNNPTAEGNGTTEPDRVIVFTYTLDNYKADNNNTALAGAKFVLLNSNGTKYAIFDSSHKVVGWADVPTDNTDKEASYTADEKTYGTGATAIMESATSTGQFQAIGLDAATYKLREVAAPSGYNQITSDMDVAIKSTLVEEWKDQDVTGLVTELTIDADSSSKLSNYSANKKFDTATEGNKSTGIVTDTISNTPGSGLPSTGGAGRFIYMGFGAAGLAAVITLLTLKKKKRA